MTFEDKADQKISEDISLLKEKLEPLDERLSVPSSLQPSIIAFDKGKHFRTFKAITIAASIIILPFAIWTFSHFNSETELNKVNKNIKKITQKANDNGVRYDEVKQVYLAIKKRNELINKNQETIYGAKKEAMGNASMADKSANGNNSSAGSFSKTNVQVDGVDEADIVKTDGDTIYSVSSVPFYTKMVGSSDIYQEKSAIRITSTLRNGEMKLLNTIEIDGTISEIYLKDHLLVILNQARTEYYDKKNDKRISSKEYFDLMRENDKKHTNQNEYFEFYQNFVPINKTNVKIFDVSKPASPVLKREFSQDGFYQSSRLVKNHLYLISNAPKEGDSQTKEDDIELSKIIPYSQDSVTGNKETLISEKCLTISPNPASFEYVVLSGLDLSSETEAQTVACLGGGSTVYANEKSLYVLAPEYSDLYGTKNNEAIMIDRAMPFSNKTNIKKFNLNNGTPKLEASGTLPGGILNQFSLDEYEGNLRVAVTEYGEKLSNSIYVLNNKLETIGKITELAPNERIYSVRFMGEKGYVVTYKQVDPLFALDLKDPTNPKVTGELKIPGFSEYLHPYSDGFLIGIGYDTIPNGYGGEKRNGLKISMFDVRDPLNPKEVQSYPFGLPYSYSEILQNHKALFYSKDKNLIGFPVQTNDTNSTNEFYVFKILENKGFELIGKISQKPVDWEQRKSKQYYGNNYTSMIQRGILIDYDLYTVSVDGIKASSIDDFKSISQIDFPE